MSEARRQVPREAHEAETKPAQSIGQVLGILDQVARTTDAPRPGMPTFEGGHVMTPAEGLVLTGLLNGTLAPHDAEAAVRKPSVYGQAVDHMLMANAISAGKITSESSWKQYKNNAATASATRRLASDPNLTERLLPTVLAASVSIVNADVAKRSRTVKTARPDKAAKITENANQLLGV